jgi:hypothetical protein
MTQKPKGKKLVYVSEEIVDTISEISKKKGTSITKFVEDVLRQAIRMDSIGFSAEEMAETSEAIQVQRVLGGTFVPLDVLNFISNSDDAQGMEQLQAKWFDSGRLYGRYIQERFTNPIVTFRAFLKAMRWDLNEVGISKNSEELKFRCISTSLTLEGTALLSKFIEGAARGMNYRIEQSEFMKGMITMTMIPEGSRA